MPRKVAPTAASVEARSVSALTTDDVTHMSGPGTYLIAETDNFRFVPDGSVDLVLTDPPFNIAQDTNFHTWDKNTINSYRFDTDKGWDTYTQEAFVDLLACWATEFERVLRKGGTFAVFCADEYLSHFHSALENVGLNVRRTLTWRKPNAVPINRKAMMMSACEYVLIGVKGAKATFNADLPTNEWEETDAVEQVLVADKTATLVEKGVREAIATVIATGDLRPERIVEATLIGLRNAEPEIAKKIAAMYVPDDTGDIYLRGCVPNSVNYTSKGGKRLHPTEKPVSLLRYLIQLLSRPDDVILDPFAGSGSTGEAAIGEHRYPILVEMDPEYFTKAAARLADVTRRTETLLTLFD